MRLGFPPIDRSWSSPNHGVRADLYAAPDSVILHYTGMRDGPSAVAWLCDPVSQVSCHYVVLEDGAVLQLVADDRRAWHAGRSIWRGETDMNSASIGIEVVNGGHDFGLPPFPEPQIAAVTALCRALMQRHAIRPDRILAHSDIAPGRKRDPGECFPWSILARHGVGLWPETFDDGGQDREVSTPVGEVQRRLHAFGYGLTLSGVHDAETETVVRAFQRRYRPRRIDGVVDAETLWRLDALLNVSEAAL
ncbi:N-acetylmuramoyl-L-alanine amidase [Lichenihabitans sp. Uapishka_5]|uniref:N-acetylmuramoyl-L-alanine amidase n=1 Tax=Lichenihabitans sp. Uapishka_5 TaxID=3037302 RepID=UPI0029E7D93B|nr:N-acetylmuramoyl-L-alanine amidase [Lichenihabitans sp. Uapishka_5]MDX7949813.1 N-acetylmuramoyl-L-alanine amidase [Lichenihabitans sp. Uapishka_5]